MTNADNVTGHIISGSFDVYEFYYNDKLSFSASHRSDDDAIASYDLQKKASIARLLGHSAPFIRSRGTGRIIADARTVAAVA